MVGTAERETAQPSASGAGEGYQQLARGLGWFSIALGLAELLAPRAIGRMIGIEDQHQLLRGLGLREIGSGIGLLSSRGDEATWLWTRVAGDALDLSLLGLALSSPENRRDRVAMATAAVLGVTALDAWAGQGLSGAPSARRDTVFRATKTVTINRTPEEVYRFWRDVENLPRFMTQLEAVEKLDERRSHWRIKGPGGTTVEWDAEILEDRTNERIAWRSLPGAQVENAGAVDFVRAPGGRGTEVRVTLEYRPPGGSMGALIASLMGQEPRQKLQTDLRAFKAILETGEIPRADSSFGTLKHAARPPERTTR